MANTPSRPLAARRAAVDAFTVAVGRRGILLTREQLLRQYELYNASEFMDRDTQQVLAGVLDALEAPSKQSTGAAKND